MREIYVTPNQPFENKKQKDILRLLVNFSFLKLAEQLYTEKKLSY